MPTNTPRLGLPKGNGPDNASAYLKGAISGGGLWRALEILDDAVLQSSVNSFDNVTLTSPNIGADQWTDANHTHASVATAGSTLGPGTTLSTPTLQTPAVTGVMTLGGDATLQRTSAGALRVDTNLGVGVAPAAWRSDLRAIQFGTGGAVYGDTATPGGGSLLSNVYVDTGGWKAIATGAAGWLHVNSSGLAYQNAPSVAAGAAQTPVTRMTVAPTGTLTLTPDAGQQHLVGGGGAVDLGGVGTASRLVVNLSGGAIHPVPDNALSLGHPSYRYTTVYAVAGAINTSQAAAKEGITPLDPAACYQAAKDVRWYEFAYLPPVYQEPEAPPDIAYDAADDNETKAEKKAARDEAEAQAKAAHARMLVETAPVRHQRGFVFPTGDAKDEAGGALPPVPDLFGLSDRESTTPQADLATLGCALQEVIRRLELLEGVAP